MSARLGYMDVMSSFGGKNQNSGGDSLRLQIKETKGSKEGFFFSNQEGDLNLL